MRGGMTMVGDNMFGNALKARVDALRGELDQLISTTTVFPATDKGATGGLHDRQLVAGRPRRAVCIRRSERRAMRYSQDPALGDPDERCDKSFRHW